LRQTPLFPAKRTKPLPGGYMGKILRVNLTDGSVKEENTPDPEILRKYPGGQALAELILMHELPEDITPLSPENLLVFMSGPISGTGKTPGGTAYTVTTFSNITHFGAEGIGAITSGSAMGYFGPYLKFAGYDGLIVSGAAKKPVYLWINNGKVEIRDASALWGKDSQDTIELVKEAVGQPEAKVASIGPAGENLVVYAMIVSDHNHTAAHGAGVVMGAKKLKAIAVYGNKRVPVKNMAKLEEAGNRWRAKVPVYEYPQSRHNVGHGVALKTLVNRNFQSTILEDGAKDFDKQEFTPRPCYECNRQCPYDVKFKTGKHAGKVSSLNAGSEHMEGAAFTFGINGPDVLYLADVINRWGMEASHFGAAAGMAFEAYEKGLITAKDTDGLELKWGDSEAVEKLMIKTAKREGALANSLADGVTVLSDKLGGEAKKMVANIKAGAPALHDWRPYIGHMLGQLISSGGIKPQLSAWELHGGAPDLGYPGTTNRTSPEGKGREVLDHGSNKLFAGACGVCWFGQPIGKPGMFTDMLEVVEAVTGWQNFSKEEAMAVGERAWQLEHMFHMMCGWVPEEDLTKVGSRFLEPIPDGEFKGFTIAKFMPDIVYDFYKECGWDVKTGKPTPERLKKLGMEEFSFMSK
ncbi:MAG: aldehyde ferredoxin oxidoreductase N-terminal domain-containing protein, partial [Dehalococcoidia bacterium]|nr:aldehyde ferredoxin oxidoreductase N-terminal domain-containing protein [Dehalococcoidia bacterium]